VTLPRANSLDALRLIAASMVLVSHQFVLMGLPEPGFLGLNTLGGFGVIIFFFLSGMLVWASWTRDPNVGRFFTRRTLRIFPALWVLLLLSVFVLGPIASNLSLENYFRHSETWSYLSGLLLLIRYDLPGVFASNPYASVVNGSLWTLPVEFLCYGMVAMVGSIFIRMRQTRDVPALFLLASVVLGTAIIELVGVRYAAHFEMISVFWWGACYGEWLQRRQRENVQIGLPFIALAIVAFGGYLFLGPRGFERTALLAIAGLLVHIALHRREGARFTDVLGDLSYGVYIFAFPVQQCVVHFIKWREGAFLAPLLLALVITYVFAYLSWQLIEKWALKYKPKLQASP